MPSAESSGDIKIVSIQLQQRREQGSAVCEPAKPLSNKFTIFTSAFFHTIDPTTSINYQLPYSFGPFLLGIPRRLGTNEALDAAADALIEAYRQFCSKDVTHVEVAIRKHTHAINALRHCLDDPVKAHSSETLAAIMVLQILQVRSMFGVVGALLILTQALDHDAFGVDHAAGAVQILKARGCAGASSPFEAELLASMRGPIIVKAIYNPDIDLTDEQWNDLARPLGRTTGSKEEIIVQSLARAPHLMSRIMKVRQGFLRNTSLEELTEETLSLRATFAEGLQGIYELMVQVDSAPSAHRYILHAHYARIYAFSLAAGIIINCIIEDLVCETSEYHEQSAYYANEIIRMTEVLRPYRPIGTLVVGFCLGMAFIGAPDAATRERLNELYKDYQQDFKGPKYPAPVTMEYLKSNTTFTRALQARGYGNAVGGQAVDEICLRAMM
ncbi:MAG: hypothetical protein M1828_007229 [Chrysothrix sp. TS-e1954]|nr:MAG: hypothetical protein M1828_007229 [Chrysothrix sp. TS-e1954]